jgi:hypothetical protein
MVWLADALRGEGLDVDEVDGWRMNGDGSFDDIWGIICHHTGSDDISVTTIARGTDDRPGPLSNVLVNRDGTVTVVAAGVAHHAGTGYHPDLPHDGADTRTVGVHADLDGNQQYPRDQYLSYVRCCAAILRRIDKSASHVLGHHEWDMTKHDPNLSMDQLRADIADHLNSYLQSSERQLEGFTDQLSAAD